MTPIRTVLCPVDFSAETERAVALAVGVARRFDARLVLEHNLEPRPPSYLTVSWMWSEEFEKGQENRPQDAERRLQELLGSLAGTISCEARLTRGPIDHSVLHLAKDLPADLIVMASHGRSGPEHHSLTERIVIKSGRPVLAPGLDRERDLLAGEEDRPYRVLIPIELASADGAVLEYAQALQAALPIRLELVHVEPEGAGEQQARSEQALERMKALTPEPLGERTGLHVAFGEPVASVLRLADEVAADLILLPAHTRKLLKPKRQAVDFELLHKSSCPIWFVPSGARR